MPESKKEVQEDKFIYVLLKLTSTINLLGEDGALHPVKLKNASLSGVLPCYYSEEEAKKHAEDGKFKVLKMQLT